MDKIINAAADVQKVALFGAAITGWLVLVCLEGILVPGGRDET